MYTALQSRTQNKKPKLCAKGKSSHNRKKKISMMHYYINVMLTNHSCRCEDVHCVVLVMFYSADMLSVIYIAMVTDGTWRLGRRIMRCHESPAALASTSKHTHART